MIAALIAAAIAAAPAAPVQDFGTAEGQCRPHEAGPAVAVTVTGLKDHSGKLRLELYSPVDSEFGSSDRELIEAGKVFRRVYAEVPASGPVEMCIRAPRAGRWSILLIHSRAGTKKFDQFKDGAGFAGNPHVGLGKPKAEAAAITIGPGVTPITIRMNYYHGFLNFGPIKDPVT